MLEKSTPYRTVGYVKDWRIGSRRVVVGRDQRAVAVFRLEDGSFHALDNRCVHRGGSIGEGPIKGKIVTCPWHEWMFDITTGYCIDNPNACLTSFHVRTFDGKVQISLD